MGCCSGIPKTTDDDNNELEIRMEKLKRDLLLH